MHIYNRTCVKLGETNEAVIIIITSKTEIKQWAIK